MTDYVAITDTQVDPDAPLTSQLGYQWRDNPIAMAEGATGAPNIATNWVEYNDGDPIYDFSVDGSVADVVFDIPDDRFEYRLRMVGFGSLAQLVFQFYRATDASYTTSLNAIDTYASPNYGTGTIAVTAPNIAAQYHVVEEYFFGGSISDGVDSTTSNFYRKSLLTHGTSQKISKIRLVATGGNAITAGQVYAERRMAYTQS